MNNLMLIVVLLDLREKIFGLNFILDKLSITGPSLRQHLLSYVKSVFEEHKCLYSIYEAMSSVASVGDDVTESSGVTEDNDSSLASLLAERQRI